MVSTVTLNQLASPSPWKNETLQEKVNKAIKNMKKDGTLTKILEKFFAGQDVTKKTKVDYTEIDISDIE